MLKEIEKKKHNNSLDNSRQLYGEGNGNPLQYSSLENPMGGGAW